MGERPDRVTPSEPFSDVRVSGGYASLSPSPTAHPSRPAPVHVGGTATVGSGGSATIEDEIDQTRAELSETIGAIQDRLDPDRLTGQAVGAASGATEQAKDAALAVVDHAINEAKAAVRELADQAKADVRQATIGKVGRMATTTNETAKGFGSGIVTTVKQNPGPAALTALGIGWLIASGRSGGSQQAPPPPIPLPATTDFWSGEADSSAPPQEQSGGVAGQIGQTVGDVAGQAAGGLATGVGDAASWAKQQAQQSAGRVRQLVVERPLPVGAVAVTLGGAAALMVPKSPRENQLLGETRDKLVSRAETVAQDVVHKVQHVAEEAEQAVSKEAKYQGLAAQS